MDYSRYLVLYSGGADSTYFIEQEKTARYLIHYPDLNVEKTKIAAVNANLLNRYLTFGKSGIEGNGRDGETNAIHALYDTEMALNAGIVALSHGLKGVVMCFNADDAGIEFQAVEQIMGKAEEFKVLTPLRKMHAKDIRAELKQKSKLRYVSCMYSVNCGFCAKCMRGF